jgi:hypothetical protein
VYEQKTLLKLSHVFANLLFDADGPLVMLRAFGQLTLVAQVVSHLMMEGRGLENKK